MIPEPYEYLVLIAAYAILIVAIFLPQAVALVSSKQFWVSAAVFGGLWTLFDAAGITLGMWEFSPSKTIGYEVWKIPIEEFIVFFLIQLNTISAWNAFAAGDSSVHVSEQDREGCR